MDLSSFTPNQRKAVEHLDGPLLICAGAGTGKTFTLTQRIAWALTGSPEEGIPPFLNSIDEALVITFTNKAAAELKGRFRSTLRSVGKFEDALKVDGAWISTIHGMCSRILREHALEVGIDPEFELAMGSTAQTALDKAIDEAIYDPNDSRRFQPLFREYDTYGVKNMLSQVIGQAAYQTRGLDAFDLGPGKSSVSALVRETLSSAEIVADVAKKKSKTAEKAALIVQQLSDFQQNPGTDDDLLSLIASFGIGRMRGAGVDDLKSNVNCLVDAIKLNRAYDLQLLLMEMARKVETAYRRILQEQSLVDTGDLIRKTLKVFDEYPKIAQQYTSRFRLIMVDEFQDTSQLQIDMIERIAGPGKLHLCTVGDSQQSIYRFQGADVGVYLKHKQDMQDNGALLVELQDNFRSNADILSFVRTVCGRPGFFVEDFLDLEAGSTGRRYIGKAPRVELAVTIHDQGCADKAAAEEARHIASRFRALLNDGHKANDMVILMGATTKMDIYANALREQDIPCMAAGGSKYYAGEHVKRCISLLNVLANPYDSISMLDVLSSEILPVSSDDLLLLATYLNENSGLMTRQNFAAAFLFADREPQKQSELLQHAMKVLKRAWAKLGYVRPSQLFMQTIIDSGWLDRLATEGEQGQAKTADILKMARLVASAEEQAGYDMTRVAVEMQAASNDKEAPGVLSVEDLEAVRLMTVHSSKGLEFPIVAVTSCFTSRTDAGSLRCETENGTVYSSLMPKKENLSSKYEFGEQINLAISSNLVEHRAKIAEVDRRRAEAERRRLFYVAVTRATDAVIVAMTKARTKEMKYKEVEADLLNTLFPGEADFPLTSGEFEYGGSEPATFTRIEVRKEEPAEGNADNTANAGDAPANTGGQATLDDASANADGQTALAEDSSSSNDNVSADKAQNILVPNLESKPVSQAKPIARRTNFFSYSAIAPHGAGLPAQVVVDPDNNGDENIASQPTYDADKATDFGSALHRTCEWIALQPTTPTENEVNQAALRFGSVYGIRDTQRLLDGVNRWFRSSIAARSYAFASCQPEVPFCTVVAGGYLEGEIDLFCTNNDGHAFIVDYKTGGNDAETPEQLFDKHHLQAMCYAYTTLVSGFDSVELHFVRVERTDAADPSQPQVVSYDFGQEDLPNLEKIIFEAKRSAESDVQ